LIWIWENIKILLPQKHSISYDHDCTDGVIVCRFFFSGTF